MENLLWLLPLLACPIGMVLMMVLMGKGMSMGKGHGEAREPISVEKLRAEQQRLSAQIDSLEGRNGNEVAGTDDGARVRETGHTAV